MTTSSGIPTRRSETSRSTASRSNDAAAVLSDKHGDRFHVEEFDEEHSATEDRYVTTASHPVDRKIGLVIVWTDRSTETKKLTRVISARAATKHETRIYGDEIRKA